MNKLTILPCMACLASIQTPLAATDLRYPWDERPEYCLKMQSDDAACKLDSWSKQDQTYKRLRALWDAEQFQLLDKALIELSQSTEKFTNGHPWFGIPSGFLEWLISTKDANKITRWKTAAPDSLHSSIAESVLERKIGWAVRGSGYAGSVPDSAWALLEQHLQRSEEILLAAKPQVKMLPAWHRSLFHTVQRRQNPKSNPQSVFSEAIARWPGYLMLYEDFATSLLPKWGGNWSWYEEFATHYSNKLTSEGGSLYSRLYWKIRTEPSHESMKFTEIGINYPLLKKSGMELVRRYPKVNDYKAFMASAACAFNDLPTYKELIPQLSSSDLHTNSWVPGFSFQYCSQWADGKLK